MRAQFMTVTAQSVKRSDQVIIDPDTLEISQSGVPYDLELVETGSTWTHLKITEPISRRKIWKVDNWSRVHVVRMMNDMDDVREAMVNTIVDEGLRSQRSYEKVLSRLAEASSDEGQFVARRWSYGSSSEQEFRRRSHREIFELAEELNSAALSMTFWASVQTGALDEDMTLVESLDDRIKNMVNNLVYGTFKREEEIKTARFLISRFKDFADEKAMAARMGVPEEWR